MAIQRLRGLFAKIKSSTASESQTDLQKVLMMQLLGVTQVL